MSVEKNLISIKKNIEESLKKSNYGQSVKLVAVTKTVEPDVVNEAIELGIEHIAENRVQEIQRKYDLILKKPNLKWHQIGTLQTNKVKYIIDKVELIHSLDRYELAKEIDRQAKKVGKIQKCLLQVKISGEESKKGADKKTVFDLMKQIQDEFENIKICGLMGMAPFFEEPEESRKYFRELKQLSDEILNREFADENFKELSMGMSNDYTVAIEEGATIVRIGSALFSQS